MKYNITTYGCQSNEADAERIEARLRLLGHKKAASEKEAGLIVLNCCSVRQSAMDRIWAKINKYKKKKIILTGCILDADRKKLKDKVSEIWHPDEYFNETPIYSNKNTGLVPIMTGCDNFCTYCAVPFTRGRERSRPAKEIIKEVKKLVKTERKEIWLLGQNVNSYRSKKVNFPRLLKIINGIPGNFKIRFVSPHPKDFSNEMINAIAKCDKAVKYINLPVQSGDNEVLREMNRNYTREHYIKLVEKIRKAIPEIKISTDVIVGFPGETRAQFNNTVNLFKQIGFDKAYISRYSPRTGTLAATTMKDNVSAKEKKRRWNVLNNLSNKKEKQKIIVVLGPTASGKSGLAVKIARKFNGEVISADSRQVYKRMDIGTGKITKKEMKGIKHYLLGTANPKKVFTAMDFKKMAENAIKEIVGKDKIPIICGGTGFYIHALLGNMKIPQIPPNWKLRKELEKKSCEELYKILKKLLARRSLGEGGEKKIIDSKNKRRLIRAIEIAKFTSCDDKNLTPSISTSSQDVKFDILWLGIKKNDKNLKGLIHKRLLKRIKQGMVGEAKQLHKKGVSWKRMEDLGLEYRYLSRYLRGKISKEEMIEQLNTAIVQYSKRQMTWFKKYAPETKWVKDAREAFELCKHGY